MNSTDRLNLNEVCAGLDGFLAAEVYPRHERYAEILDNPRRRHDASGVYSGEAVALIKEVRQASAEAGFYTLTLPPPIGSVDLGWEGLYRLWEHLFYRCGTRMWLGHHVLAHWTKGPNPLLMHAQEPVRDRYLGALESGSKSMCFGMSEPEAGSDIWSMRSRATPVDGGWQLSGVKQWISNGSHADLAVVFAISEPELARARKGGIGAFLVPMDSPGVARGPVSPMFGQIGSNEATLYFDDVFVPDDHVVGDPLNGFGHALTGVSLGRAYNCAKVVGLSYWALDIARAHANTRTAFGSKLGDMQAIAFKLADQAIEAHSARVVAIDTFRRLDIGADAANELAIAKVVCTEMAVRTIDAAMQVLGAMGFTNEVGLSEAWQMARVVCVADGSAEILRRQVARRFLREGLPLVGA
ncbi:acyl-CoA dehydrogenase [Jatrophihabitans sp.]|uniref:acyl-CoA dehydrogenase family protein n=1 Tax=Jatrophihabitans sp. TaxID=1932789 RepID=UPI0030C73207